MGALVSALAFPVPDRKYSEEDWATQGDRVVWLTTKESKLKVPALHLRRANTKASSNKHCKDWKKRAAKQGPEYSKCTSKLGRNFDDSKTA